MLGYFACFFSSTDLLTGFFQNRNTVTMSNILEPHQDLRFVCLGREKKEKNLVVGILQKKRNPIRGLQWFENDLSTA